ncbi:MAG TPA: pyrroline-5-carboxylate reductase [Desulfomicrobiaceae bacterium]|nr:pyrroline-5-carboxylate reductase [Desulfomicrobiaceae bacterium]
MAHIAIIGLGNMGGALARGWGKTHVVYGYDPNVHQDALGPHVHLTSSANEAATKAQYVILAVKPQIAEAVTRGLRLPTGTVLVSVAAGIPVARLKEWSGGAPVVRVMPNTPALIGQGVFALCVEDPDLSSEAKTEVPDLFAELGQTHILPERLLDAYTGLIGSGPAYVFAFMEALIDAGVLVGIARPEATAMVRALIAGSVAMAQEPNAHPALLREAVTSPGGTTIAGLATLDACGFRHAIFEAVRAATRRSEELGRGV